MTISFRVTYDIVTHESAENGDTAENGFIDSHGFQEPIESAMKIDRKEFADLFDMPLREALRLCCPNEDCGNWWSETDGNQDYQTGAVETRALHPPKNITGASYARLSRLMRIRP